MRKTKKRLVIELDDETHYSIKLHACTREQTLREWVLIAIAEQLIRDEEEDKSTFN